MNSKNDKNDRKNDNQSTESTTTSTTTTTSNNNNNNTKPASAAVAASPLFVLKEEKDRSAAAAVMHKMAANHDHTAAHSAHDHTTAHSAHDHTTTWTSDEHEHSESAVRRARTLFLVSLCLAAVVIGVSTFVVLRRTERRLAERQFDAIAKRALFSAQATTSRKRRGTQSLAQVVSNYNPNASAWPYVYVQGFEDMATALIDVTDGRYMAFVPLLFNVTPETLQTFNDFAYNYFENTRRPPLPPGTGAPAVEGKGVWQMDMSDRTFHTVTDAVTTRWEGQHNLSAPALHFDTPLDYRLMFDIYKVPDYGHGIDMVVDCAQRRKQQHEQGGDNDNDTECSVITEIDRSAARKGVPISMIFHPIYPAYDPYELTGIILSSIVWNETLINVFDDTIEGIDCVVETEQDQVTYRIRHGMAEFVANEDLHERDFNNDGVSIVLTVGGWFSESSATYKLTIFPSNDFRQVYRTPNPVIASLAAAVAILLTSCCFLAYDFLVSRDSRMKKQMFVAGWNHRKRAERAEREERGYDEEAVVDDSN
jgi:hypothetical protein